MFKHEDGTLTRFVPVIFPAALAHADVAEAMRRAMPTGCTVHSAGEVDPAWDVSGGSEALGVRSDPEDGRRMFMADYGGLSERRTV